MKILRLLIAATLMLAVPFQGALAVSAGQCMALGHHDAPADAGHDHGDSHDGGHDQAKGQNCGPCVACCAAAAISTSVRVLEPEVRAESIIAASPLSFSGLPPKKLERPPLAL